jgi:hypothetical protein
VWVAIAWMGGQDGGARSRKAFAVRSPSPGPAAALLAGRGGAPAAFAGACTEWTFKERDARACAYANFSDSQGVGRSVEGQDRQPVSRDVLPRLSSPTAKHPALGGLADMLEGKGHWIASRCVLFTETSGKFEILDDGILAQLQRSIRYRPVF